MSTAIPSLQGDMDVDTVTHREGGSASGMLCLWISALVRHNVFTIRAIESRTLSGNLFDFENIRDLGAEQVNIGRRCTAVHWQEGASDMSCPSISVLSPLDRFPSEEWTDFRGRGLLCIDLWWSVWTLWCDNEACQCVCVTGLHGLFNPR